MPKTDLVFCARLGSFIQAFADLSPFVSVKHEFEKELSHCTAWFVYYCYRICCAESCSQSNRAGEVPVRRQSEHPLENGSFLVIQMQSPAVSSGVLREGKAVVYGRIQRG